MMSATLTLEVPQERKGAPLIAFAGATAVVALHAVADAFIWPERGTRWSDHLVPGLATLAVLAAMLVLFWFARPGLRAVLALVLGALAVEGAALAITDAVNVGVRGDDWTGFLLAPAGLALWLLGTVLLWRSRKPGRLRWLRRAEAKGSAICRSPSGVTTDPQRAGSHVAPLEGRSALAPPH